LPESTALPTPTLDNLGWRPHFANQLAPDEQETDLLRITAVQRASATGLGPLGEVALVYPPGLSAGSVAVGDWVLREPDSHRIARLLTRETSISRRAAGAEAKQQLIAANVDTLFITTSCNADFNLARLERYIALALDANIAPVLILTKADESPDSLSYLAEATSVSDKLAAVIALNARDTAQLTPLRKWCTAGQTVAFIGSSGVGKSTLINGLTGGAQSTAGMREDDAKGRHTTTSRSLHLLPTGGMLIDMPGMRELALLDVAQGINALFDDITALAQTCKFRDCAHNSEPGCAVTAAIADGTLDAGRVARWNKLKLEDSHNTATILDKRYQSRSTSKMIRSTIKSSQKRKGR
jgi:ribosome biogenesis GTPase